MLFLCICYFMYKLADPEWVRAQTVKRLKDQLLQTEIEMNERLRIARERESERKAALVEARNGDARSTKRRVRSDFFTLRIMSADLTNRQKIQEDLDDEEMEDKEFLPRDSDEDLSDYVSATLRK